MLVSGDPKIPFGERVGRCAFPPKNLEPKTPWLGENLPQMKIKNVIHPRKEFVQNLKRTGKNCDPYNSIQLLTRRPLFYCVRWFQANMNGREC